MSLLGLGHVRHYSDAEWPAVKAALQAAGIEPGEGMLFPQTSHVIAAWLANDPLVQAAEKAIADVGAANVPLLQRISTAALDVVPALVSWYASGGIKKEAADLTSIATSFTQDVFNLKNSVSIKGAIADAEAVLKKL